MESNKPRGKTPSLIGSSNGKPKRVMVKKKSHCSRCKCGIDVGQDCFGIPKVGSGFTTEKRYCKECFDNILAQTQKDLEQVKTL